MDTLKEQLRSKKFRALLAALVVWLVGLVGLDLSTMDVLPVLGLIATYIVGQGIADKGKEATKEAAKVEMARLELEGAKKRRPSKQGS